MDLIKSEVRLLNSLAESQSTKEIEEMRKFCNELVRKALSVLYGNLAPPDPQEISTSWPESYETTQPLPTIGAQVGTYATTDPGVPIGASWMTDSSFDISFGNVALEDGVWHL
jgi:hypothetical protein